MEEATGKRWTLVGAKFKACFEFTKVILNKLENLIPTVNIFKPISSTQK